MNSQKSIFSYILKLKFVTILINKINIRIRDFSEQSQTSTGACQIVELNNLIVELNNLIVELNNFLPTYAHLCITCA